MWKLKLLKNRPARASVQSVAATSAAVPVSQVASLDNSQAASAAIADLTTALDFVFDFLHDDGLFTPGLTRGKSGNTDK